MGTSFSSTSSTRTLVSGAWLLAASACSAAQGGSAVDGGAGTPVVADASRTSEGGGASAFVGAYAGLITYRRILSVGSLGSMPVLVSIYATIQIADDPANARLTLSAAACHADTAGTGTGVLDGSTLQIPDVVMTTTQFAPVTFSATGSGTSQTWHTSELHAPIGWKWTSPDDTLPTSASDPRVFNQDGDNSPGVTMNVLWQGTTTPVAFVQTERDTFSGSIASNGDLVGTTTNATEQNVISNGLAGAPITSANDPNTADNAVRIVRVPAALTCAQLMTQTGSLFPSVDAGG